MPNYRYHAPESVCRNGCMRRTATVTEGCPSTEEPACGCTGENSGLDHMAIAMAYVPWQKWRQIYRMDQGLQRGTIFEELDKPFRGTGGCCNGR